MPKTGKDYFREQVEHAELGWQLNKSRVGERDQATLYADGRIKELEKLLEQSEERNEYLKSQSAMVAHTNVELRNENEGLEDAVRILRVALQAAFDCGMVPNSTAKDGGANRHVAQVRVADMLRDAMEATNG